MGKWLSVNGDGIYGTTFYSVFGEGEVNNEAGFFKDGDEKQFTEKDFRFTFKDCSVYAFQMRPKGKEIRIKTFRRLKEHDLLIENIELLGGEIEKFERTEEALVVTLKEERKDDLPLCLKIDIG